MPLDPVTGQMLPEDPYAMGFDPYLQQEMMGPPGSGQMGTIQPQMMDPMFDPMMMGDMGGVDPMTGMPIAPDPMGMDPMAMMAPMMLPEDEEPPIGPAYPRWYKVPKRPDLHEVIQYAEEERFAHAQRVAIAMEMRKRLNLDTFGYFAKDIELIESQEVEPAYLSALRDEHDMACAYGASMDWNVESVNREVLIDKEEMAAKEDLAAYLFECDERQHARSGWGPLKWALFDTLQAYGMLVGFDAIDVDDDESGVRMRLIDPATVFPVHEGQRGLQAVYRVYTATAASVIGDFGSRDGTVEKNVKGIAKGSQREYDPHYVGEVVEYWDRNWVLVAFDNEEVLIREHGYARVPFTITYGCFGQQGFTRTSDNYYVNGTTIVASSGGNNVRMRAEDLARTAQPFLWRRIRTHDIEEALSGLMITAFRRAIFPPVVHYRSILSIGQGAVQVDRGELGYTPASEDDRIEAFPIAPAPEIINPLMAYIQSNRATGAPSGIMSGQMPGAQTSGSAIDILASSGYQRWFPLIMCVQQFLAERTEWRMALLRDWGAVLGQDENLGTMYIPRRRPNPRTGEASAHIVTPEMLRSTGIRTKVELRRFDPSTLSQTANGLQILRSMALIDKRRAIKIAGIDPDPDAVMQDIDMDELYDVPEVKQEKVLRTLKRMSDQAKLRNDWQSAIDIEQAMYFIASVMEQRMSIGQPALGPDGQRLKPIGGGAGGPAQAQGMSMPMMGIDTGTMGGRPMG